MDRKKLTKIFDIMYEGLDAAEADLPSDLDDEEELMMFGCIDDVKTAVVAALAHLKK